MHIIKLTLSTNEALLQRQSNRVVSVKPS